MDDARAIWQALADEPPFLAYQDLRSQRRERLLALLRARAEDGERTKAELAARGPDALAARARAVRDGLLDALGGLPGAGPDGAGPPPATRTGSIERPGHRIDKVLLAPRPGVLAPALLYVPQGLVTPAPAVLFLCGHDREGKASPQYQRACAVLAGAGLVVLALDPVGQGERIGYQRPGDGGFDVRWGCPEHDHAGAQCLAAGRPSARYFLHDAMRALDWLASLPEVDPARLGATGNSGGGTQTALLMAADPRLAAAAPATYLTGMPEYAETGIAQDLEQIWPGLLRLGFDHDDVLLAMAPRPVLVLSAKHDYFPPEGTRRTVASARRFWAAHGRPEDLEAFEDDDEHRYSERMMQRAADFFSRRFLGRPAPPPPEDAPPLDPALLRATATGQVATDRPGAAFLFEENRDAFRRAVAAREADRRPEAERRAEAHAWVRRAIGTPDASVPAAPRRFLPQEVDGLVAESLLWRSEEGVHNAALVFRAGRVGAETPVERLVLAVRDGGTRSVAEQADWIRAACRPGVAVAVVDLDGCGALEALPVNGKPLHVFEGTYCAFAHDLLWLGDSWPALRARGVLRAVEALAEAYGLPVDRIEGHASGAEGLPLLLSAFAFGRPSAVSIGTPPPDPAALIESRLYDSTGVLERILPGLPAHVGHADLLRWATDGGNGDDPDIQGGTT